MGERVVHPRAVKELVESVRRLLSRFADPHSGLPKAGRNTGVRVRYSKTRNGHVLFEGVTRDGFKWSVDFDLNAVSREYLDGMIEDLKFDLDKQRQAHQKQSRIVLPGNVTL